MVGAAIVAKAPADGHTLLISSGSTFTVNPAIRPNLPYDPLKSFDPIAIVARIPLILLANKDVPVDGVAGFVDLIKTNPDKYAYASFGSGTTSHFTGEILLHALGLKLLHIPFKGSGPAMTDLIGGQVPFSVDTVTAAIPQLKARTVKAVAVTTAKRSSQLPDVPTFAEAGYVGVDADTWIMLAAPRGTPQPIRERLEKALAARGRDTSLAASLLDLPARPGLPPQGAHPQRLPLSRRRRRTARSVRALLREHRPTIQVEVHPHRLERTHRPYPRSILRRPASENGCVNTCAKF